MDFQRHHSIFSKVNGAIDISNHLSKWVLWLKDPVNVPSKTLDVIPFNAFNANFIIKPTIINASVSGFSKMQIHHVDVVDHTVLSAGLQVDQELHLKASINMNVVQTNSSWYAPCFTDPLHPSRCDPLDATLEVEFGVVDASADVTLDVELMGCPTGISTSVCSDLGPTDLLTLHPDSLLQRLLLRTHSLEIRQVNTKFNRITAVDAHFTSESKLLRQVQAAIEEFSIETLNQHGVVYDLFMKFSLNVVKILANLSIKLTLAPRFGSTCYEPKP